jgi:hypothetical protein
MWPALTAFHLSIFLAWKVNDGVNHPKDGGGGVVGYLRYEKKQKSPAGSERS